MSTSWLIEALLTGLAVPFRGDEPSAIAKTCRTGKVRVTPLGLEGDEQADRENHGGTDMAVHHYPQDHYPDWRRTVGHPLLDGVGALGENVSVTGLVETEACIGDRFRLGSALVEISQGRKPCWKPAHRLGHPALVAEIVTSRRSGWYYRVLEAGEVCVGDALTLLDRPHPDWSVARVFGLIVAGEKDGAALRALAALPALSQEWRSRAERRAS